MRKRFFCIFYLCFVQMQLFAAKEPVWYYPPPYYHSTHFGFGFLFSMDFTLWTARDPMGSIAADASFTLLSSDALPLKEGGIIYPKWFLRPGFKVYAGIFTALWTVDIQYTWFYNKGNRMRWFSWDTPNTLPGWPFLAYPGPDAIDRIQCARSKWQNTFNRFDVCCRHEYYILRRWVFAPFIGILGFWDHEKWLIDYTDFEGNSPSVSARQKSWGIGPYTGGRLQYIFYQDIQNEVSFVSNFGTSIPWSQFTAHVEIQDNVTRQSTKNVYTNITQLWEVLFGVRWKYRINRHTNFFFQLAWEEQILFDHMHAFDIFLQRQGINGNLVLQGLSLKGLVQF